MNFGSTPRKRRFHRTQQAILDASRAIIAADGIAALSMRAIADRIDYSVAGLYEYYAGKEEIIAELCIEGHQRFFQYLDEVDRSLPVRNYIDELGHAYLEFARQNPDYFVLIFTTAPIAVQGGHLHISDDSAEGKEPLEPIRTDSTFDLLVAGLQRGVDEGVFLHHPDRPVLDMALGLWGMVHGMAMLQVTTMRGMPVDFDHVRRMMFSVLAQGLATPE